MTEHAQVVRIAKMRARPGQHAALLDQLQAQAESLRRLPGVCTTTPSERPRR
jgi:quinol monooxygenase YgiN